MVVPRRVPGIVELLEFSNGGKKDRRRGDLAKSPGTQRDFPTGCPCTRVNDLAPHVVHSIAGPWASQAVEPAGATPRKSGVGWHAFGGAVDVGMQRSPKTGRMRPTGAGQGLPPGTLLTWTRQ